MSSRRASGFTLIEMVIAIVIISVGLAGVLLAFTTAVKSSADPLIHKQMLAIAEEMMEEILLKPYEATGTVPTKSATTCSSARSRAAFDDVSDYDEYETVGICDIEGNGVDGLATYGLKVTVVANAAVATDLVGLPIGSVKKVTVIVTHGTETVSLVGWRTWYACDLPTICPS